MNSLYLFYLTTLNLILSVTFTYVKIKGECYSNKFRDQDLETLNKYEFTELMNNNWRKGFLQLFNIIYSILVFCHFSEV